jgi:hypothetical protein
VIRKGHERAPHRSLLTGWGPRMQDFSRVFSTVAVDAATAMGDRGTRYSLSSADEGVILSRSTGFSQGES